jgi:hypothetical protein
MPQLRSFLSVALLLVAGGACATHTGPAPLPSAAVRSWQVYSTDGASARIFFRNDASTTQTISSITLLQCVNTREDCKPYPVHLVLEPKQVLVGMTVQRRNAGQRWSVASSYTIDRHAGDPELVGPKGASRLIAGDQVKQIAVEEFVPAVRAMTTSGTCGEMRRGVLTPGSKALVMFFSPSKRSKAERMVSVIFDADGRAVSYNDQRGDIFVKDQANPDAPRANPRTVISLDLVRNSGMLHNDGGKIEDRYYVVSGPDLATANSLGRPADLVSRIWKECNK